VLLLSQPLLRVSSLGSPHLLPELAVQLLLERNQFAKPLLLQLGPLQLSLLAAVVPEYLLPPLVLSPQLVEPASPALLLLRLKQSESLLQAQSLQLLPAPELLLQRLHLPLVILLAVLLEPLLVEQFLPAPRLRAGQRPQTAPMRLL
jgi:hypothetical protein